MAPTAITIPQAQTLLRVTELLREAFPDTPTGELSSTVSLFLVDNHDSPAPPSGGSKGAQLIELLKRPQGASVDEVVNTFGIKKNSAYARISVEARKRKVKLTRVDGRYHAAA